MCGNKSLNIKFWTKYFQVYDYLNHLIPYQELLNELINELTPQKGELILDAGAGTGNLAVLLEKLGVGVIALDFSKEALDIYKKKNPQAQVVIHNLEEKLPFPDNYFDKVATNNTIYNIPREKRLDVFKEFYRVLKPEGVIVTSNIHADFKPLVIYLDGVKKQLQKDGLIKTLLLLVKLIIPTIKIFYYNRIIQKIHKVDSQNLFDYNEQEELLRSAGFSNISESRFVYSGQAILNKAKK